MICANCGKNISRYRMVGSTCGDCYQVVAAREREIEEAKTIAQRDEAERQAATDVDVAKVILTTEAASNIDVIERIEIVTAECAYGLNLFKDLFAGVRDVVGGRSKAVQAAMRDARKTTLMELKREAHAVGANAVIGVDLDYVELSAAGNMVMLVASGTAVRANLQ